VISVPYVQQHIISDSNYNSVNPESPIAEYEMTGVKSYWQNRNIYLHSGSFTSITITITDKSIFNLVLIHIRYE
jgi:hypothetical protein